MSVALRWLALTGSLSVVAVASCAFEWDGFDPRLGNGGSSVSAGGMAAVGGAGGTLASGGAASSGTVGGAGGMPPALVDRGLVTRYYLDEAASDMAPTLALDAAPDPLDLPLDYGAGAGGGLPNMSYVEVNGQRGLTWLAKNGPGSAALAVAGTKLQVFDGATAGTIECVVQATDSAGAGVCGRLSQLGVNNNGNFTLCLSAATTVSFRLNTIAIEQWTVPVATRRVLHAVMDTTLADPEQRVLLYVDGVDQGIGSVSSTPPTQGDTIVLTTGDYVLGNRVVGDGSVLGTLFYCALYSVALDADEVAHNAGMLGADDDAP